MGVPVHMSYEKQERIALQEEGNNLPISPMFKCDKCGKVVLEIADVGYIGPVERDDQSCNPLMTYTSLCAACEGRSVLDA